MSEQTEKPAEQESKQVPVRTLRSINPPDVPAPVGPGEIIRIDESLVDPWVEAGQVERLGRRGEAEETPPQDETPGAQEKPPNVVRRPDTPRGGR